MSIIIGLIAIIVVIPLMVFIESVFVKLSCKIITNSNLSQMDFFKICLKKFLAVLVIGVIIGTIGYMVSATNPLVTLIINSLGSIAIFFAASSIYGNYITDENDESIEIWKGMGAVMISGLLMMLTWTALYAGFAGIMILL